MKKVILFPAFLLVFLTCTSQTDVDKVNETVSKNDIEGHIYFLASDELKGRETGTTEIDIAASYLANSFRRYGVKPANNGSYYQSVELEKTSAANNIKAELNTLKSNHLLPLSARNFNFTGDAIFLNYGLKDDYKNKNVKGKLVVVKAGTAEKSDARSSFRAAGNKRKIASEHGAAGLIELSNADDTTWKQLSGYFGNEKIDLKSDDTKSLVHVWLQDAEKRIEKELISSKKISGKLSVSGIVKSAVPSRNVVGIVEGTDPKLKDEYIIYSAHYDHIGIGEPNAENDSIYNGARDNAVGTVTVLSAAKNIAKYPTKRSALFILFTGEEKGLLGSKWYVEHPIIPLKQMVYCFNSDNGGYNDTSIATIVGLNRTTAGKHISNAVSEFGLKAIDDPAGEQGLFDRSDNVNFAAKGIPAPTFSLGFTAFDKEINKYYHKTSDNPETLDYDYLEKFFKSYVMACRLIANDPKTPFWIEGDKYYEIGKKLYTMK
ncbi:M28 family peptidase [Aureibaculum marinum]|uniref:M28 family peptidase n=1 Tax=Aureibaculum marinum TaxID=2487930 RepID=A0A3N4NT55_9FLAO|nr:M28 family peptidase [Aureibaculum marinum]RPD99572.1 M28 family peptidase [Aureibaculum marinum]